MPATTVYAPIGTSVSGGWNGLPANPRRPLNFRPRSVSDGRNENLRMAKLSGRSQIWIILPHDRQRKSECRPAARLALDLQLLAMQLEDLAGKGDAQPGAAGAT